MKANIRITEVGPRDGLQNESASIPTETKVEFINQLSNCGFAEIEVSSFVSPKWVPQLADAAEVFAGITKKNGVVYSALVPNEKGLDAALAAKVDKVAVFTTASETFSQKNTNASIAETLARFKPVVERAKESRLLVRAYISCAVACPYEGPTDPVRVREVAAKLLDLGVDEIDLGDTIGVAVPTDIERLYDAMKSLLEPEQTTLHLHNTRGTALACAERAVQLGVRSFDSSCGGLGGCPYAPGASGNVATEELCTLFDRMGCQTGVNVRDVMKATSFIARYVERSLSR